MPTKKKKTKRGGMNYRFFNQSYLNPVVNTFNPFLSLDNFLYVCENNVCRKLSYAETKNVMDEVQTTGALLADDTLKVPDVHKLNNNTVYFCSLKDKKISEYFYLNESVISDKTGGDVSKKKTIYPSQLTLYPDEPIEQKCGYQNRGGCEKKNITLYQLLGLN